jgi:integrase
MPTAPAAAPAPANCPGPPRNTLPIRFLVEGGVVKSTARDPRQSNLRRSSFLKLLRSAKPPQLRAYDLRYTGATLLLPRGAKGKLVSKRIGHESVEIMLRHYPPSWAACSSKRPTWSTNCLATRWPPTR